MLPMSHQEQDANQYTIPALNNAKRVLYELGSHITIIRKIHANRNVAVGLDNIRKTTFYEVFA